MRLVHAQRHTQHGRTYVPLRWSDALKADSLTWAQHLLDEDKFEHDADRGPYGENLAINWGGAGQPTAESVLSRECARFVAAVFFLEEEASRERMSMPDPCWIVHLRQVGSRTKKSWSIPATDILRRCCGGPVRGSGVPTPTGTVLTCRCAATRVQVKCCIRVRPRRMGGRAETRMSPFHRGTHAFDLSTPSSFLPGNCNMAKYDTWLEPMLMDDSPCGAVCHPDDC